MSAQNEAAAPPEIVIVRRRSGGDDDGHHGSAWKIAYADFVTAMMAFFLVMWLINSSDKQTLVQVAAYFNPIKLNSKHPTSKGIEEASTAKGVKSTVNEAERLASKGSADESGRGKENYDKPRNADLAASEQELFADPFEALNKIAMLQDPIVLSTPQVLNGGTAADASKISNELIEPNPDELLDDPLVEGTADKVEETAETQRSETEPVKEKPPVAKPVDAESVEVEVAEDKAAEVEAEKKSEQQDEKIEKLEEQVKKTLETLSSTEQPLLQFERVPEGILITLTDQFDYSMFRLGSAKPTPELIRVIDAIAESLEAVPGDVVIRGHTDATPFVSKVYDNWRLSTARAQMARYMLMRGGLEEKRIARIEGYGSRSLRIKSNPKAAENRRIEILLRN